MKRIVAFLIIGMLVGCGSFNRKFESAFMGANEMKCEPHVGSTRAEVRECFGEPSETLHRQEDVLGASSIHIYKVYDGNWKTGIRHYSFTVMFLNGKVISIEQ